jgi:hypothetical protein
MVLWFWTPHPNVALEKLVIRPKSIVNTSHIRVTGLCFLDSLVQGERHLPLKLNGRRQQPRGRVQKKLQFEI